MNREDSYLYKNSTLQNEIKQKRVSDLKKKIEAEIRKKNLSKTSMYNPSFKPFSGIPGIPVQGNGTQAKKEVILDASGNEVILEGMPGEEYAKMCGNNWTGNNVSTLLSWLTNANYNIQCLDLSIEDCSQTIRHNVVLGLLLSTGAGTVSVANIGFVDQKQINFILSLVFTITSYIVAINTGRIKVYQIQERLEQFIKLRQEWIYFVTTIAVEFQTPVNLRKDALQLILNNKEKYLDLMKRDCEFTERAKKEMEKRIQEDTDQWFFLNNDFYNSHVSLLNFSKGIRINDLVDSMSYFEGINLIEAEKSDGYDPNKNIAPFYDKVDKYKVIRHFYEIDIEEKRRKSIWEASWESLNKILFPAHYKQQKMVKEQDMIKKRKERMKKELDELDEEEKHLYQVFEKYKHMEEQKKLMDCRLTMEKFEGSISDVPEEKKEEEEESDLENQLPTHEIHAKAKGWFDFF